MANPYTAGNPEINPFADEVRRGPPQAPAPATQKRPPSPQAQFYNPPSSAAAQGPSYQPPAQPHSELYGPPNPPQPNEYSSNPTHEPPPARDLQTLKFWTMEFYQQFFDVDTTDVIRRMGNVMLPFTPPDFLLNREWHHTFGGVFASRLANASSRVSYDENTRERTPDLYGPFWISTTLWLLIGVVGNAMSKIAYTKSNSTNGWSYNFQVAYVACITIYAYVGLMSLFVWGVMKWKNVPAGLVDVLCLYGYSMFILLLASILCAVPSTVMQWLICFVAGLWSGTYLIANFWQLWKRTLNRVWFVSVVCIVVLFHIGLTLSLKFYFFNYSI